MLNFFLIPSAVSFEIAPLVHRHRPMYSLFPNYTQSCILLGGHVPYILNAFCRNAADSLDAAHLKS
jgi:hypothetical protein